MDIPDTVGITMPWEFGKLVADIKANTPGIENVVISTHCHNDLGLAVANTIAVITITVQLNADNIIDYRLQFLSSFSCFQGARAGPRQLEVTINGIGERAGNAALEEVLSTFYYLYLCM